MTPHYEQGNLMKKNIGVAGAAVLACFFLTGCFSLTYQLAWVRLFTLVFGNTVFAVSAVVAAFMAGLGAGGYWFGRRIQRGGDPVRIYGIVEIIVGVYALAMPALTHLIKALAQYFPPAGEEYGYALFFVRFAVSLSVLLPPTFLMGASLPLLTKYYVSRSGKVGSSVSFLYGLNTAGAVAGVFIATFLAMPSLGIFKTIAAAACANVGVGLLLVYISLRTSAEQADGNGKDAAPGGAKQLREPLRGRRALCLLGAVFIAGFTSMLFEVAWMRVAALLIGGSIYSFSLALLTILIGIAVGGFAAGRHYLRRQSARPGALAFCLFASAVSAAVVLPALPFVAGTVPVLISILKDYDYLMFAGSFAVCCFLLLLPAVFLGAAFPIAAEMSSESDAAAPGAVGKVYMANTAGAILGSLLTGFWLIPSIGARNTLALGLALGCAGAVAALAAGPAKGMFRRAALAVIPIAACAAIATGPFWNAGVMTAGPYISPAGAAGVSVAKYIEIVKSTADDIIYYHDGLAATVSVHQREGNMFLRVNGKTDASSVVDLRTQTMLSYIPLALKGDAKDVLIIGVGSGSTAGAALEFPVERVRSVELEPSVIEASKYFKDVNNSYWEDPRHKFALEDARNFLLREKVGYDVIISQPSNPWLSGAAGLFTRESFAAIRGRLKPGGLSCQWIQAYGLSEESLLMVLATYTDVFPNTLVFRSGLADIILIGSVEPIDTDAFRIDARLSQIQSLKNRLNSFGIHDTLSLLLTTYVMGAEQLAEMTAGYGLINTDDRPLLEFVAPIDLHKTPYDVMGERYMENYDDIPAVFGVGTENFGSATWHSMGNFFAFQLKDPARAEKMYLNALKADPGMEAAMLALASLYKSMNKPLMAISYYTRVRNISPNDAQITTNIIRLYVQQNLYDIALAEIDALLEKAPDSLAVKKLRGDVLHLNGDMKAALEQYRAIEREMREGDPRLAPVYMAIAYVAEDMKDGRLATEYLEKIVRATPSNLEALVKLANWLMKSGDYSAAIGHLDAALKIAPDSLEALHLRKRALRLMNARP